MHDRLLISHDELEVVETNDRVSPIILSKKPMALDSNSRALMATFATGGLMAVYTSNWIDNLASHASRG